jgi:hypothetical protein
MVIPTTLTIIGLFCGIVLTLYIYNWWKQNKINEKEINDAVSKIAEKNRVAFDKKIQETGAGEISNLKYIIGKLEARVLYLELCREISNSKLIRSFDYYWDDYDIIKNSLPMAIKYYKGNTFGDHTVKNVLEGLMKYLKEKDTLTANAKTEILKLMEDEDLKEFHVLTKEIISMTNDKKVFV